MQVLGIGELSHSYPLSTVQLEEHPSPEEVSPSSHPSPEFNIEFPQLTAKVQVLGIGELSQVYPDSIKHEEEHPSPDVLSPSSQVSPEFNIEFPHARTQLPLLQVYPLEHSQSLGEFEQVSPYELEQEPSPTL